jgi:rRNA-processing protein CGR1
MALVKAKEKEMKEEKEAERLVSDTLARERTAFRVTLRDRGMLLIYSQRRITALKEKRAKKEEKARYEKLAETMHRKRVERLKRKEKRNKMIKS